MKLLAYGKDGGPKSKVWGFWFIEIKSLFSVVLLHFEPGSREVYHSHAFSALTWFLSGEVEERLLNGAIRSWRPSLRPKHTPRSCFHQVWARRRTWALSFRGPWNPTWREYHPGTKSYKLLTHGRVEIRDWHQEIGNV